MKRILIPVLVFLVSFTSAQKKPSQFSPDRFIIMPSVEWAAFANYNIRFENPALNKLLIARYEKNEIKAAAYVWGRPGILPGPYESKKKLDEQLFHPHGTVPQYDSLGNQLPPRKKSNEAGFDTAKFTMTDVTQILYVENGRLQSYIPWISTLFPVTTSFGVYLGEGGYFSTCLNYVHDHYPAKNSKNLFLSTTTQKINPDSIASEYRLKELYGRNLFQTIWPYVLNGSFVIYSAEDKKLKKEEIEKYLRIRTAVPVPVYDTNGTVTGSQLQESDFEPKNFTEGELVQDWYYNPKENIVFNKIKALYLFTKSASNDEHSPQPVLLLKIVFN